MKKNIGVILVLCLFFSILGVCMFVKPNIKNMESPNDFSKSNQELQTNKEEDFPKQESINVKEENTDTKETGTREKINIYLFWGDGCPHCENVKAFLNSLSEEYTALYTLHTYEVWKNAENKKLMKAFSEAVNQNTTSVPFLIIGSEVFIGYTTAKDESIKKAIKEEYSKENRVDYYKEIKENE